MHDFPLIDTIDLSFRRQANLGMVASVGNSPPFPVEYIIDFHLALLYFLTHLPGMRVSSIHT